MKYNKITISMENNSAFTMQLKMHSFHKKNPLYVKHKFKLLVIPSRCENFILKKTDC